MKIFVSYSSRDRKLKDLLVNGLQAHLSRAGELTYKFWSDKEIDLGANWKAEIENALEESDVALLLVSANFASSTFIQESELADFLKKKKDGKLLLLPVLVRKYNFERLEELSSLNFFKTYQSDYGFNDPSDRNKLMHFDKLAENDRTSEGQLNDYYYHLTNFIDKAVKNWVKEQ